MNNKRVVFHENQLGMLYQQLILRFCILTQLCFLEYHILQVCMLNSSGKNCTVQMYESTLRNLDGYRPVALIVSTQVKFSALFQEAALQIILSWQYFKISCESLCLFRFL